MPEILFRDPSCVEVTDQVLARPTCVGFRDSTLLAWATGQDPVHIVFSLLLAVGTLGVLVMWVLTSAAIVKFFRTEEHDVDPFKAIVAPVISGLGLLSGRLSC